LVREGEIKLTLLQLSKTENPQDAIINDEDALSFEISEGDIGEIVNENTKDVIYCIILIDSKIPHDTIALGQNIIDNLSALENDIVSISKYEKVISTIKELIVELNFDYSHMVIDNTFRLELINFLRNYIFNQKMEFNYNDPNSNLTFNLTTIIPDSINEKPPYRLTEFNDEIIFKIRQKYSNRPFNAILCLDCSASMAKKDIYFNQMNSVVEDLINIYQGNSDDHRKIIQFFRKICPKLIINPQGYSISRIESIITSLLMFFNQKISRGLGELCSILLYSGNTIQFQSKMLSKNEELNSHTIITDKTYIGGNTFFDLNMQGFYNANELSNALLINELIQSILKPENLNPKFTNFSNVFEKLKETITKMNKVNQNPIMILFLTDGKPEPINSDPPNQIEMNVKNLASFARQLGTQIVIYTIGIGHQPQIDESILMNIAKLGYGEYHFAVDLKEISNWFETLANNFSINLSKI
jgi:hypothetical protein